MTDLKDLKDVLPLKIIEDARKAFAEFNLTEAQKQKAIEKIVLLYNKSRYEPGEAVGVVTAQSVSEPGTQMAMRSYQLAGTVEIKVTQGLPRLIEIFDARKEPQTPMMIIHLQKSWNSKEKAKQIVSEIQETTLGSIMDSAFVDILNMQVEYVFDDKKLKSFGLNLSKIFDILKEIKTVDAKAKTHSITVKPKNEEVTIKELQKLRAKLLETHIKGIKGITQAIISEDENEWVIKTLGTNLAKILAFEGVDASRTVTNDIHEVAKVLGIEAARAAIVREALATLGGQGLDVDVRHILLIADVMTVDGIIRPIGRYGVAGSKGSLLARANFEETIKHLTNGSLAGETDKLESIVENVMINQIVPVGTGMFDLTFSPKKAAEAKE